MTQALFPEPQQLLDWEIDNSPWPMQCRAAGRSSSPNQTRPDSLSGWVLGWPGY
jgi:hypothetical protein